MYNVPVLGLLVVALASSFAFPQKPDVVSKPLWSWSGDCNEKRHLGIEVMLRGKLIYQASFPICPVGDGSPKIRSKQTAVFQFKGGHVFQGEYHTVRTETIEGNIWQAGTDPGAILFGLSFSNGRQVLLNTVHIAKLSSESTSEIDRGLKVRTFPVRRTSHP